MTETGKHHLKKQACCIFSSDPFVDIPLFYMVSVLHADASWLRPIGINEGPLRRTAVSYTSTYIFSYPFLSRVQSSHLPYGPQTWWSYFRCSSETKLPSPICTSKAHCSSKANPQELIRLQHTTKSSTNFLIAVNVTIKEHSWTILRKQADL